jgi:hypothetical protein
MNIITINGKTYSVEGSKIVVRNSKNKQDINYGKSYVQVNDNVVVEGLSGDVKITFTGDLATLDCTSAVINGNVHGNVDCTSLICQGNIGGDVDATSVKCNDIQGDVDATTVHCKTM